MTGNKELATGNCASRSGLTLVELIITVAIVGILASGRGSVARSSRSSGRKSANCAATVGDARRHRPLQGRGDKGGIQTKADSFNYPPDLETLVDGVDVQTKKVRFLRSIPIDPMTGTADWGLRSNQDDADSDSWGGQNVFDVHSKSTGTALDGTKYNTW